MLSASLNKTFLPSFQYFDKTADTNGPGCMTKLVTNLDSQVVDLSSCPGVSTDFNTNISPRKQRSGTTTLCYYRNSLRLHRLGLCGMVGISWANRLVGIGFAGQVRSGQSV